MRRTLKAAAVALIVGAGALIAAGCSGSADTATQVEPTAAPIEESLVAQGLVIPAQSAALSLPAGGVVADVLVAEGAQAQAGQPLLRLDQTRARAALIQAEAQLAQAQAQAARVRAAAPPAAIAGAEAQVREAEAQLRLASGSVTPADRAAAQAQLAEARARLAALQAGPAAADERAAEAELGQAQAGLAAQRDGLSAAKTSAQLQMEQAVQALTQAQSAYATAKGNWERAQESGRDPVQPDNTNPQTGAKSPNQVTDGQLRQYYDAFVQAEAAMRAAETQVQAAQVAFDAARQQEVSGIQLAEQQVAQAQSSVDKLHSGASADELAAARAQVAQAQAGIARIGGESRGGALDAAQAGVDRARASLELLLAGASPGDVAVADAGVKSAEAAVRLARAALAETELRAPFAGVVAALSPQVGEYLVAGSPAVQLADLSRWQVETTDLTELSVARIRVGSPVTVTLDALPGLELPGRVSRISPFGENKQGDITYAVLVTLDRQDERLRWNMTASVAIAP
jgi:HlyD family secretion protein